MRSSARFVVPTLKGGWIRPRDSDFVLTFL